MAAFHQYTDSRLLPSSEQHSMGLIGDVEYWVYIPPPVDLLKQWDLVLWYWFWEVVPTSYALVCTLHPFQSFADLCEWGWFQKKSHLNGALHHCSNPNWSSHTDLKWPQQQTLTWRAALQRWWWLIAFRHHVHRQSLWECVYLLYVLRTHVSKDTISLASKSSEASSLTRLDTALW